MKRSILGAPGIAELLWLQAAGIAAFAWLTWPRLSDVDMYFQVSGQVLEGHIPYRDFPLEYPPLALVPFLFPRLLSVGQPIAVADYYGLFLCLNVVLSLLTALCVAAICSTVGQVANLPGLQGQVGNLPHGGGRRGPVAAVAIYGLLAVVSAPVLGWRYDAFPALLTALGLLAVVRQRPALAGLCLGLGTVAKIYPMVLLGFFGAYYLAAGERRALLRMVCASVAVAALVMLPFRLAAPDQWLSFLAYHRERGFEIGSSVAGALMLAGDLGLTPVTTVHNYGARHVVSPLASALLPWTAPALVLAVGGVLLLYLERFGKERDSAGTVSLQSLASGTVVVLLVFIIVNKVFSPQYIVWLIPFVPLLTGRGIAVFLAIAALTIYVYPFHFEHLVYGQLVPALALNCRNLLVVGLILLLWFSRRREAGAASLAGPLLAMVMAGIERARAGKMLWLRVPLAASAVAAVVWLRWPWGPSWFVDNPVGHKRIPHLKDSGFHGDEFDQEHQPLRWTNGKGRLVIPIGGGRPQALLVRLHTIRPPQVASARLQITINGRELCSQSILVGPWQKTFTLTDIDLGSEAVVEIVSDTFVPKHALGSADERTLGVEVRGITLLGRK